MKKRISQLLAAVLVAALILPILPPMEAKADVGDKANYNTSVDRTDWGYIGDGLLMGLSLTDTPGGIGDVASNDPDDLYNKVNTYSENHYISLTSGDQHNLLYYAKNGTKPLNNTRLAGVANDSIKYTEDTSGILAMILNEGFSPYLEKNEYDRYVVKKECIEEVMDYLGLEGANAELYQQYKSNPCGVGGYVVVAVIEGYALLKDGDETTQHAVPDGTGTVWTTSGLMRECGVWQGGAHSMDLTTAPSDHFARTDNGKSGSLHDWPSKTASLCYGPVHDQYVSVLSMINQGLTNLRYDQSAKVDVTNKERAYARLFCVRPIADSAEFKQYNTEPGVGVFGDIASIAVSGVVTNDDGIGDIQGYYPVSCGGVPTTPSAGLLAGRYEWDFDAPLLPANNRSHNEDCSVEVAKGGSVNGEFKFGYVNPQSEYWGVWTTYGSIYNCSNVRYELQVRGLGTGNGADQFTTDRNTLLAQGNNTASGVVSQLNSTYTGSMSYTEFVQLMKNGGELKFDGFTTATNSILSGSMTNGQIAVAYATTLTVYPDAGPQADGVIFNNNQVHYAQYSFDGVNRTYKFFQTGIQGYSQLKDNDIGQAQFEAMSGTPTTENMFISMGGSEYIVNMQYRFVIDDYIRKYKISSEPFDNYMYYKTGLREGLSQGENYYTSSQIRTTLTVHNPSYSDPVNNLGWTTYKGSNAQSQVQKFVASAKDYKEKVQALFDGIDENTSLSGGRYDADNDYDVIVTKGITLGSDWGLQDIESHVHGRNTSAVAETVRQLNTLSYDLKQLYNAVTHYNGTSQDNSQWADSMDSAYGFNVNNVVFCRTVNSWNDWDSEANGDVIISFNWHADNTEPYDHFWDLYAHNEHSIHDDKVSSQHPGHGGSCTSKTETPHTSETCGDYLNTTESLQGHDTCDHDTDPYTEGNQSCDTLYCLDKQHSGKTVKHLNWTGGQLDKGLGGPSTPGNWPKQNHGARENPSKPITETWTAIFQGNINVNYSSYNGKTAFTDGSDVPVDRAKKLSINDTLVQVYKDVKYMDIVDCHVWRLVGGVSDGDSLTPHFVEVNESASGASSVITPVIEMAARSKGYTLYNTQAIDYEPHFETSGESSGGTTYPYVWRCVDQEFAGEVEDDDVTFGANNELQAIGRLANSYNQGTSEGKSSQEPSHGLYWVVGNGDNLSYVYDTESQGGWSHWSFDGMLKQAIACTFYQDQTAESAIRNYLLVQSDYLALGDQPVTMQGFMFETKNYDKNDNTYGLTQAVFNCDDALEAADLHRYWVSGDGWKHHSSLADRNVNTSIAHAGSGILDIAQGNGGSGEVVGNSKPSDHIASLQSYADGGSGTDEFGLGTVMLDMDPEYATYTKEAVCESNPVSGSGLSANFSSEGKDGSGGNNLQFQDNGFMYKVGYDNKYDSVKVDEHIYEPEPGGTTTFDPNQTFVNGGYNGLMFADWGVTTADSHLYIDNGATAAPGKQVSCSSQPNYVQSPGLYFPKYLGLNVIRWLTNNEYPGASTALVYDECIHVFEGGAGILTKEEETVKKLDITDGNFGTYKNSILTDLHNSTVLTTDATGESTATTSRGSGIITGVGYSGATANTPGTTNSFVVFNPTTTANSMILPMSEDLPDGQNVQPDPSDPDSGYIPRDQRITAGNTIGTSVSENYMTYTPLESKDVVNYTERTRYVLKDKSLKKTTAYVWTDNPDTSDYKSSVSTTRSWHVEANSRFDIPISGDYTFTLFDGKDQAMSADVTLTGGDTVYTDGSSFYVERNYIPSIITYEDLREMLRVYYMQKDSLTNTVAEATEVENVNTWIKGQLSMLQEMENDIDNINFDWETTVTDKNPDAVTLAVEQFNSLVDSLVSDAGSNPIVVYSDAAKTSVNNILTELSTARQAITVNATLCNVSVTNLKAVPTVTQTVYNPGADYKEPYENPDFDDTKEESDDNPKYKYHTGSDTNKYQTEVNNNQRDTSNWELTYVDQARGVTTLANSASQGSSGVSTMVEKYSSVYSKLNALFQQFTNQFNSMTNGDTFVLSTETRKLLQDYCQKLSDLYDLYTEAYNTNSTNITGTKLVKPTWDIKIQASSGRATTFEHTSSFEVDKNSTLGFNLNGFELYKGDVLKVRLPLVEKVSGMANSDPVADFKVTSTSDPSTGLHIYRAPMNIEGEDFNCIVYYIEALEDQNIGNISIQFSSECEVSAFGGSCVTLEPTWIMDVGTGRASDEPARVLAIEHEYQISCGYYKAKSTRDWMWNSSMFSGKATGMAAIAEDVELKTNTLYFSLRPSSSMALTDKAAKDPHKVWNNSWKYYVVGWLKGTGTRVSSVLDPDLDDDNTLLYWPDNTPVLVKDLRTTACLVTIQGVPYLTTKELGLQHKVPGLMGNLKFDRFTMSSSLKSSYDYSISEFPNMYPLDGSTFNDYQHVYEFFFSLSPDGDTQTPLYDVQSSRNTAHKYSTSPSNSNNYVTNADSVDWDWEFDWDKVADKVSNVTFLNGWTDSNANADYVSLDDEFSLYFPNIARFEQNPEYYNQASTSTALGYGWNADGLKLLCDDVNNGIADYYMNKYSSDGSALTVETEVIGDDGKVTTEITKVTETTAWLYAKYVKFDIPVYVFKDETGKINPTCNAYDSSGRVRDFELIEAGTPIPLGYSLPTSAADNTGKFVDLGAPDITKDRDKKPFVYHFWCPLAADESIAQHCTVCAININDRNANGDPSYEATLEAARNLPTAFNGDMDNYSNWGAFPKPGNSFTTMQFAVVGRIGAFTIVDTGDPRYSDSFKLADLSKDDVDNFLIYPIIRKIHSYSNDQGVLGSQRGIVLDPFDVRGRICVDYLRKRVRDMTGNSKYDSYHYYADGSGHELSSNNTYGTQWFKSNMQAITGAATEHNPSGDAVYADAIPLTPNFNMHNTFKFTPLRVGYELYCSLESIGNYSGFSNSDIFGLEAGEGAINANNDVSNMKVQVRPFYAAVNAVDGEGREYNGPVDVYMRSGDTYVLINTSPGVDSNTVADAQSVVEVLTNNYNPSYIQTNTNNNVLDPDETLQRRMVTDAEAQVNKYVTDGTSLKSILHFESGNTEGIGGTNMDIKYTYGCSQLLFLRERNRTFIGGGTAALNYQDAGIGSENFKSTQASHAQKWYFGLGLPSSAVFVEHGRPLTEKNVLKTGYVVLSVDVIISGLVWKLHYESDVSRFYLDIDGTQIAPYADPSSNKAVWNPWYYAPGYNWLIPVTYFDIEETSTSDLDTEGSH